MKSLSSSMKQKSYVSVYIILAAMALAVAGAFGYWYYLKNVPSEPDQAVAPVSSNESNATRTASFELPELPYETEVSGVADGKTKLTANAIYAEDGSIELTLKQPDQPDIQAIFTDTYTFVKEPTEWTRYDESGDKLGLNPDVYHVPEDIFVTYQENAELSSDPTCSNECTFYNITKTKNGGTGAIKVIDGIVKEITLMNANESMTITYKENQTRTISLPDDFTVINQ